MSKAKPRSKAKVPAALRLRRDLVVLVADKDTREAIEGLLTERTKSLGIPRITHAIITHPQHDPGCLNQSVGLLSVYRRDYHHAMVVFDREGSGQEGKSRTELETTVEADLRKAGWEDRAAVVVIDPELENWVWSPSPHVASCLGWNIPDKSIRDWLVEEAFLAEGTQGKPDRPKEAMGAVLRLVKKPRSSAIFRAVAARVALAHCIDPAFEKLRETLSAWFPVTGA